MVTLFWITYIPRSGLLMLHPFQPQFIISRTVMTFHVAEQVKQEVCATARAGDMGVLSVTYVSGFVTKQLLRGVNCHV
jgi:hypothetical protein